MSIKSFVLVLTAAALAGASQASPATGPESPETDGSPGCDKSSPLYPHAETFAATAVRPTRATLRAGAWTCVGRDENGELIRADWARESRALSYYYEWGPTRRYGSRSQVLQTVRDEATGIRSALQALIVDGLRPGLTYHYRVVVRSELYPRRGWSRGADMTLTTPNKSVRDRLCSNPVIRRARPLNVAAGELLRLTGTGLGRSGILTIGGRRALVVAWSPRAITARLPDRVSGRSRVVAICGESVSTLRTPDAPQVRVIAGKAG